MVIENNKNAGQRKNCFIEMPLIINTYDIDAAGHVNNIVFVRWLEDLRTKLLSEICDFKKLYREGYYLVVISISMKYKKQLKIFDHPDGFMEMISNKHGIITFKSLIKSNNIIAAIAEQKCVILNLEENKVLNEKRVEDLLDLN